MVILKKFIITKAQLKIKKKKKKIIIPLDRLISLANKIGNFFQSFLS